MYLLQRRRRVRDLKKNRDIVQSIQRQICYMTYSSKSEVFCSRTDFSQLFMICITPVPVGFPERVSGAWFLDRRSSRRVCLSSAVESVLPKTKTSFAFKKSDTVLHALLCSSKFTKWEAQRRVTTKEVCTNLANSFDSTTVCAPRTMCWMLTKHLCLANIANTYIPYVSRVVFPSNPWMIDASPAFQQL